MWYKWSNPGLPTAVSCSTWLLNCCHTHKRYGLFFLFEIRQNWTKWTFETIHFTSNLDQYIYFFRSLASFMSPETLFHLSIQSVVYCGFNFIALLNFAYLCVSALRCCMNCVSFETVVSVILSCRGSTHTLQRPSSWCCAMLSSAPCRSVSRLFTRLRPCLRSASRTLVTRGQEIFGPPSEGNDSVCRPAGQALAG